MYLCEAIMSVLMVTDQSINQLWKTVKTLFCVCPTLKTHFLVQQIPENYPFGNPNLLNVAQNLEMNEK